MTHPFRGKVLDTFAEKHSRLLGGLVKAEHPWQRAERISQATPPKMTRPPEQAVPQFENDRGVRDVPYGSTPPHSDDD